MTDTLPKVNLKKDGSRLTSTDLINMKRVEEINFERANRMKKIRVKNIFTAGSLFLGVVGIYFYTIHAVKQEEFLDDFIEPEKISSE